MVHRQRQLIVRTVSSPAALSLNVCATGVAAGDRPKPKTQTLTIEGMRFLPEVLTVAAGDTILWVNKDLVPHTATSTAGSFDSKGIQADQSWKFTIRKTRTSSTSARSIRR